MKPERLLPLILLIAGVAVFYFAYEKKTEQIDMPPEFNGDGYLNTVWGTVG